MYICNGLNDIKVSYYSIYTLKVQHTAFFSLFRIVSFTILWFLSVILLFFFSFSKLLLWLMVYSLWTEDKILFILLQTFIWHYYRCTRWNTMLIIFYEWNKLRFVFCNVKSSERNISQSWAIHIHSIDAFHQLLWQSSFEICNYSAN